MTARARRPLADEIHTIPELMAMPARLEVIAGTLDEGTTCLIAGHFGSGKSFHAISISAAIASGTTWFGRATMQRKVLYIAAEGVYGLPARFDAWSKHYGVTIPENELEILTVPVQLTEPEKIAELCKIITAFKYRFVVIDTLSKSIVGADENSAQAMSVAVSAIDEILDATAGGNVLVIHHTGKDKTTVRGSSALEAGVDIVYLAEAEGDLFRLKRTKRKDGPLDDERSFELVPVRDTESVTFSVRWGADITDKAKELLSVLVRTFGEIGATKAELRNVADMPPATFHRGIKTLVEKGLVRNTGTESRPHYKPTEPTITQ
jgi:predicted ATP-dependent serine protease